MASVSIILLNPNGDEFLVEISLQSSILELKQMISNLHPQKPSINSQRLLFSGKFLRDNEILSTLFCSPGLHDLTKPQKFHLLIRNDAEGNPQAQQTQQPQQHGQQPQYQQGIPGGYQNNPAQHFHQFFQQGIPFGLGANFPPMQFGPQMFPQQPLPNQAAFQFGPQAFPQQPLPHQQPAFQFPQQFPQWNQQMPPNAQPMNNPFQPFQLPFLQPQGAMGGMFQMPENPIRRIGIARININFTLILKLALLVYVLGQGGSTTRFIVLIIGAIAYLLYKSRLAVHLQRVDRNQNQQQNENQQNENQQNENVQNQNNNNINNINTERPFYAYHPNPIVNAVVRFAFPFVLSLLPNWELPESMILQQPPQQQEQAQPVQQ